MHRVPGGQHRFLVGDVDGAAEGRHAVRSVSSAASFSDGVAVQVQADDGPAVPGEPVGGGPADAALGAHSGDDDGALRVLMGSPAKAGRRWRLETDDRPAVPQSRAAVAE